MSRRTCFASIISVIALIPSLSDACEHITTATVYASHQVVRPVRYVSHTTVVPAVRTTYKPAAVRHVTVVRKEAAVVKTAVRSGATININGDFFGGDVGRVFLKLNGVRMDAQVTSWSARRVTVTLPLMAVGHDGVAADLQVFSTTGRLAKDLDVLLKPAIDDIEEINEVTVLDDDKSESATVVPEVAVPALETPRL